jgi:hypothetical protein
MKNLILFLTILTLTTARGATIADWTFENSKPNGIEFAGSWYTNVTAEIGLGTASAWHSSFALYSAFPGNGSSAAFGVTNGWSVGDFYQLAVSTVGDQNISLSYDQSGTSTGPGTFYLEYSTDGNTFTQFGSNYSVTVGNWTYLTVNTNTTFNFDLSSVSAIDGQQMVYFRIVDASATAIDGGPVEGYEDDRVDNVVISAQAVPEPAAMTLAAVGGLFFALSLKRSSAGTHQVTRSEHG